MSIHEHHETKIGIHSPKQKPHTQLKELKLKDLKKKPTEQSHN